MNRYPNTYECAVSSGTPDAQDVTVVDNQELAGFLAGESSELSREARIRLRTGMTKTKNKMDLFLTAYGQKNMSALGKIYAAMDTTTAKLTESWRIQSLDTAGLMDVFDLLRKEKNATFYELMQVRKHLEQQDPELSLAEVVPENDESAALSPAQKKRVIAFLRDKLGVE